MFKLKKILVPIDFSEASVEAFHYAFRLAAPWESTIYLLHAADDPMLFSETTSESYRSEFIDDANRRLVAISHQADNGVTVHVMTQPGPAPNVILETAESRQIDLIVMGSHGRSKVSSMLLGSVAEYVLRHGPCPVLTVRRQLVLPSSDN